jgi:hypothetical protein
MMMMIWVYYAAVFGIHSSLTKRSVSYDYHHRHPGD